MKTYNIKTMVDVRRFPTSRLEHFRRENPEVFLKREGITYVYLGDELGGYRKGYIFLYEKVDIPYPDILEPFFPGYLKTSFSQCPL